ncbi:hypothetical protein J2S25_000910 [Mesobacillus stamsii]|uniref:YqbQ/XkdQ domain-containing protein n=2 Tax=Mesobacillus stamsii TaxID=225347 RepID=A0ABU0FS36_9BACI|nr:hypothetical protein [Mesobacillus stamsii]
MEFLIDNRQGDVYDIPIRDLTWKTERIGKAGTVEASLVLENPLKYPIQSGAIVRVMDGKHKVFYGYLFDDGYSKDSVMTIKAYDQLRYLMNEDTFVIPASPADKAILTICKRFGLKVGTFENTGYVSPGIVEDGKKAFDVVSKFLDASLVATNQNYILFDDFGKLSLKNIKNMVIKADDFYIGEDSLLFSFNYKRSIDNDTYNRVKFVRDNKKRGKRETFIFEDSTKQKKWGLLQHWKKIDENMTDAQIKDLGTKYIQLKGNPSRTLDIECLGNWKIRAGSMVFIYIEKIGIKEYFLVDECTHRWKEGIHTMSLKVKVI